MPPISVLIKPSSGNCNLRCDYCFYYDTMAKREQASYGFMDEETLDAVLRRVLEYAEGSCAIAFQGGEPTLSGLPFFKKAMELQERHNINGVKIQNAIQTNGYNLDQEWADFFVKFDFLVGVSLDGNPRVHDCYRKTGGGDGSFLQVMKNIELLKKAKAEFNILSVVHAKTAPQIRRTYEFYRKNGLNYLQFIACLDPLWEEPGKRDYSLTPEAYGTFLIELFDLWYTDLLLGKQPYIRQFENYIAVLFGQMPESCDMRGTCGMQYVVEADGSVYPCDFYVVDQYRLGNMKTDSMEVMDQRRRETGFIEDSIQKEDVCESCAYREICRGGCRRTRQEEGHHQYFCPSYRMFFDACLPRMKEIAYRLSRNG